MANRTAWTAGNGVGYTWTTVINSSDLTSMANASSVLSSVSDITNQTSQDMFMDLSAIVVMSSAATLSLGANLAFFIYALQSDGTTYGDGQFTAGTQAAKTPAVVPCGVVSLSTFTTSSIAVGYVQQVTIPPGSFRLACQNNTGLTLASGTTSTVKYRTYNLNLNN